MSLGDIIQLKEISLLEAIGALVLFVLLCNIVPVARAVKDKLIKSGEKEEAGRAYSKSDIRVMIDSAIKRAILIFSLKEYKTLQDQMSCVEKATLMIKSIIIDNFQEMKGLKDHPDRGRDIRAYLKIIHFTMGEAKETLKGWIKSNHLLERTDIEFQVYVKETVRNLLLQVSSTIDEEYFSEDFIIDRAVLKKHNVEKMTSEISEILSSLLMTIRDIAEDKQKQIKELEAEEIFEGSKEDD